MISIWGCNVNDKTCKVIGEFSVAWAQFELDYFGNDFNAKNAELIAVQNTTEQITLIIENVRTALLCYASRSYGNKALVNRLCIRRNEKRYIDPITDFLSEKYFSIGINEKVVATVYIGSRIRNNMFHGLKDIATLNDQIDIFKSLSDFFVYVIEKSVIYTGIYPKV